MSGSGGKKETPSYAEEMFEHKVKWLAGVDSPASEALSTEVYQELLKEDEKKAAKVGCVFQFRYENNIWVRSFFYIYTRFLLNALFV